MVCRDFGCRDCDPGKHNHWSFMAVLSGFGISYITPNVKALLRHTIKASAIIKTKKNRIYCCLWNYFIKAFFFSRKIKTQKAYKLVRIKKPILISFSCTKVCSIRIKENCLEKMWLLTYILEYSSEGNKTSGSGGLWSVRLASSQVAGCRRKFTLIESTVTFRSICDEKDAINRNKNYLASRIFVVPVCRL